MVEMVSFNYHNNDQSHQSRRYRKLNHSLLINSTQKLRTTLLLRTHHLHLHHLFRILTHRHLSSQPTTNQKQLRNRSQQCSHPLTPQRHTTSRRHARLHTRTQSHPPHHEKVIALWDRKAIYFLMLASWIVCGISLIPHLLPLVTSRFLLGVLNGLHMSLASSYIKETFPSHIRKPLGAVYSTCRIFGMLLCYLFA